MTLGRRQTKNTAPHTGMCRSRRSSKSRREHTEETAETAEVEAGSVEAVVTEAGLVAEGLGEAAGNPAIDMSQSPLRSE